MSGAWHPIEGHPSEEAAERDRKRRERWAEENGSGREFRVREHRDLPEFMHRWVVEYRETR